MGFSIRAGSTPHFSWVAAFCGMLLLPQAANAFFCFKSGSGHKGFGRSMPYPAAVYPPAAYRLPPIMPRQAPPRRPNRIPVRAPTPLSWRPLDYRP